MLTCKISSTVVTVVIRIDNIIIHIVIFSVRIDSESSSCFWQPALRQERPIHLVHKLEHLRPVIQRKKKKKLILVLGKKCLKILKNLPLQDRQQKHVSCTACYDIVSQKYWRHTVLACHATQQNVVGESKNMKHVKMIEYRFPNCVNISKM